MKNKDDTISYREIPAIVFILTGVVFLFIACVCVLLVLFLIFGPKLIYNL